MRPGEKKFTRSVKVRDLVPAPFNLPGESWRTSMQASIAVDAAMPWMSVTPTGWVDTIFYDYNRTSGLMDAVYGQVAPGGPRPPAELRRRASKPDRATRRATRKAPALTAYGRRK